MTVRIHPHTLDVLNHYGFEGREDFSRDFNVLVIDEAESASLVFLKSQLHHKGASFTHIAPNAASLSAIHTQQQQFDYISCTQALDRLGNIQDMLLSCKALLAPGGVLLCAFDGYYGQLAANQLRTLIQLMGAEPKDIEPLLQELPPLNWYKRCAQTHTNTAIETLFSETKTEGLTVPRIHEHIAAAGLYFLDFVTLEGDANVRYVPETLLDTPHLSSLSREEKQALGEMLYGSLTAHFCYVSNTEKKRLIPDDTTLIPFLTEKLDPAKLQLTSSMYALYHAIDGKRSIADLLKQHVQEGAPYEEAMAAFIALYERLHRFDWILLRAPSC